MSYGSIPSGERESIKLAETTDDPKLLEELYSKNKERPSVVRKIVNNPYCQSFIKRDYLDYILMDYLVRYRHVFVRIGNWDDLLESMRICLEVWNPPRETSPRSEIDLEDPFIKEISESIENFKQVILYGPPGTSKTHYARGLANSITDKEENIDFVQFHPSYSYEDFVEGIFPEIDKTSGEITFNIQNKTFKKICEKAENNPKQKYVLIIDEINRADLSKVFGEIFSALEYRKETIHLLYSKDTFYIPLNLYIIGTMNTLDKSTIDVDFALMRRFRFFEINPNENTLIKLLTENDLDDEFIRQILAVFKKIQEYFPLGHAYFKDIKSKTDFKMLWDQQISFLLKEYFGDLRKEDYNKIKSYWEEIKVENQS